ncbi:MAG TPA: hypothetical protein VJL89_09990 [Thermodesulfovibrionia bacterium]|nr:hypothetical protein [Thermodesulfovibrionia bacterium]
MKAPLDQLLYSRSARDIINLAEKYPDLIKRLANQRPLLMNYSEGRERPEELPDAEKRSLMRINENRLYLYLKASEKWMTLWQSVEKEISNKPLFEAHQIIIQRAYGVLPFSPTGGNL